MRELWLTITGFLIAALAAVAVFVTVTRPFGAATPVEKAWVQYAATHKLIVLRYDKPPVDDLYRRNTESFHDLVKLGELVEIRFPFGDQALHARLYESLCAQGAMEYRYGPSILGGQWPVGLMVVEKRVAKSLEKIIAETRPGP